MSKTTDERIWRVLCLHGKGVNGRIFAAQARALQSALGSRYELIFVDAPLACAPYPGIERFFPEGPFLSWYDETEASKTRAVERIKDMARQHKTTAVMGFSQGAAIAAACNCTPSATPFQWAIYIGGGWPLGSWQAPSSVPGTRLLTVPAVHVVGAFDVARERGLDLWRAQQGGHLYEWSGHHEVPRLDSDVQAIASLVNRVAGTNK